MKLLTTLTLLFVSVSASRRRVSRPDDVLPRLSRSVAHDASMEVAGQGRRLLVTCFADFKHATPKQEQQTQMMRNWGLTTAGVGMRCVIGFCKSESLTRRDVSGFIADGACAVVHIPAGACVANARLGRWSVVQELLSWGYDVVSSDPDVAFVQNVVPYFAALYQKHPEVDVLSMSDASTSKTAETLALIHPRLTHTRWSRTFPNVSIQQGFVTTTAHRDSEALILPVLPLLADGTHVLGLESPFNCEHQYNTGWMLWRATDRSATLLRLWIDRLAPRLGDSSPDDQRPFHALARERSSHCRLGDAPTAPLCGGDAMLAAVSNGRACFGLLNLPQFANGFVYASQRAHEMYGLQPYLYHATYTSDKVQALTEEGFWKGELKAWDRRFLVYTPTLLTDLSPTWRGSFALVQHQLRQLHTALSYAVLLNRTLVLPRFALSCHCFFYAVNEETCLADGLRHRLPYAAPIDHVLKPGKLRVPHVPHGYLDDVVIPKLVKASWRSRAIGGQDLHVQSRVLELTGNLEHAFPVAMGDAQPSFDASIHDVLGSWCCITRGVWPHDKTFKARYTWRGDAVLTPADDPASAHGTCGL